jgi:hypothetical protein
MSTSIIYQEKLMFCQFTIYEFIYVIINGITVESSHNVLISMQINFYK